MNKVKIQVEKRYFLQNERLVLRGREKNILNFISKIFPTSNSDKVLMPEPTLEATVFDTPKPRK